MKSGTVEAALGGNYIKKTPIKKLSFSVFFFLFYSNSRQVLKNTKYFPTPGKCVIWHAFQLHWIHMAWCGLSGCEVLQVVPHEAAGSATGVSDSHQLSACFDMKHYGLVRTVLFMLGF